MKSTPSQLTLLDSRGTSASVWSIQPFQSKVYPLALAPSTHTHKGGYNHGESYCFPGHCPPTHPTPPHPTHAHDECIPVWPTAPSPTPHQLPLEEHSLLLWGRRWLATEPGSSSPCHRQAPEGSHPTVARQTQQRCKSAYIHALFQTSTALYILYTRLTAVQHCRGSLLFSHRVDYVL